MLFSAPILALSLLTLAPPPKIPELLPRGSAAVQSQWEAIKGIEDAEELQKAVRKAKLTRLRCHDVVHLSDLMRTSALPLRLRDTVRWRTMARPEMVALVAEASRRLKKLRPNAYITVGDVAQQGCGQIRWGTLIHYAAKADLKHEMAQADQRYGVLGSMGPVPPDDFMDEWPRFHLDGGPVWVERSYTGRTKGGEIRIETRRFDPAEPMSDASFARLMERTQDRLADRRKLRWSRVKHTMPGGELVTVSRAVWHNPSSHRWMEAIFRPGNRKKRARASAFTLLRVREAMTDVRKPTSLKAEERYLFDWNGEAGVTVMRHRMHYEAHHSSHLGGFDADLSFVTVGNEHHFNPVDAQLDAEATWLWLKALNDSAKHLGIPMKALFVDRSIRDQLKQVRGATRDPAWRKVRRSPGHDSHVHVRIGPSARWAGKTLPDIIKRLDLPPL